MQDFNERRDLQRLLKQQIEVIAPDTLVIAEELCEWDESLRRIDLLGIDRNANLVVVEADLYTVQLKKKAEENRQAKHFAPDFSKYDLTVGGSKQLHLTKRRLVLEVIRAAIAKGFSLDRSNPWSRLKGGFLLLATLHLKNFKKRLRSYRQS